jgi:hypothetical protein
VQAVHRLDRHSHLADVVDAAPAHRQMLVNATALLRAQRVIQVVRDEPNELLTLQDIQLSSVSPRYRSNARLTVERARCKSTR